MTTTPTTSTDPTVLPGQTRLPFTLREWMEIDPLEREYWGERGYGDRERAWEPIYESGYRY